jgi:hypothetical protein
MESANRHVATVNNDTRMLFFGGGYVPGLEFMLCVGNDVVGSVQVVEVEEEGGHDLEPCLQSAVWGRAALIPLVLVLVLVFITMLILVFVLILILVLGILLRELHLKSCRLFQNGGIRIGGTDWLLVLQLNDRHGGDIACAVSGVTRRSIVYMYALLSQCRDEEDS